MKWIESKIFLIDAIGALVSGLSLVIITFFPSFFGISWTFSFLLLPFSLAFAVNSFWSFRIANVQNRARLLRRVAFGNATYLIVMPLLVAMHIEVLARVALFFFAGEFLIVCALTTFQFSIAKHLPA